MAASNRPTGLQRRFGRLALGAVLWLLAGTAAGMDIREAQLFEALDRFDAGNRSGGSRRCTTSPRTTPTFVLHD